MRLHKLVNLIQDERLDAVQERAAAKIQQLLEESKGVTDLHELSDIQLRISTLAELCGTVAYEENDHA